jgi:excisionase family DNA binding protein
MMPVIRRKLASASAPQRRSPTPTPIRPVKSSTLSPAPHQGHQDEQRVFNFRAAAKYLGTSVWQVRKFVRDGELRAFPFSNKTLSIDRSDLDALVERKKQAA